MQEIINEDRLKPSLDTTVPKIENEAAFLEEAIRHSNKSISIIIVIMIITVLVSLTVVINAMKKSNVDAGERIAIHKKLVEKANNGHNEALIWLGKNNQIDIATMEKLSEYGKSSKNLNPGYIEAYLTADTYLSENKEYSPLTEGERNQLTIRAIELGSFELTAKQINEEQK